MNKADFLTALEKGLAGLPRDEREKNLAYYSELIDDMLEDGMSEAEAIEQLGSIEEIYENILSDTPLPLAKQQPAYEKHDAAPPRRKNTALIVVLLVLGFPIWFSVAIAILAAVLGVYITVWAVVISLFALIAGLAAAAIGFAVLFAKLLVSSGMAALFALGMGLILLGLTIPAALLAVWAGKLLVRGTKALCCMMIDHFRKEK